MRDAIAAHREGVPTVVLVHPPFERLARTQAGAFGVGDLGILVYEQDALATDDEEKVGTKAESVARGLEAILLDGKTRPGDDT